MSRTSGIPPDLASEFYVASNSKCSILTSFNPPHGSGVKTLMRNLKGRLEEQDYACVIFLFAMKEAEENWPSKIIVLKRYDLYEGLKETGLRVKKENEDKIKRMLLNLKEINKQEKLCTDLIEKELRSWKLKGHCEFV